MCWLIFALATIGLHSCQEFLDVRPDKKMVIATTVDHLQAIFDNTGVIKSQANIVEIMADNYYLSDADFNAQSDVIWYQYLRQTQDIDYIPGWTSYFRAIFYVNEVLERIHKIDYTVQEKQKALHLEGSAYFVRALDYFHLAQIFAVPYIKEDARNEKGLPLRLSSDFNQVVKRSNLQDTYQQIISDFTKAILLLPAERTDFPTRPWKASAYAGMANVYLAMEDYIQAELYADSALQYSGELMDFSKLDIESETPFLPYNEEVLYFSNFGQVGPLSNRILNVDTLLYKSYKNADLRRSAYFKRRVNGTIQYKGDYLIPGQSFFNGLSVAEMYLVRAECKARRGDVIGGKADLKILMDSRWVTKNYIIPDAITDLQLLDLILDERRRELVMKGRRWYDIRRLYHLPEKAVKLFRKVGNDMYEMDTSDKTLNTLNIPDEAVRLGGY